jgi:hypothetical protein
MQVYPRRIYLKLGVSSMEEYKKFIDRAFVLGANDAKIIKQIV